MKKISIFLAVLVFALVLSGCGTDSDAGSSSVTSDEIVTDVEIDEAVNPDDVEPEETVPLSTEVILPENINTTDLVDIENEINASVSDTTREATKQYVQTLIDAGFSLDYEFEVAEGSQYSLSKRDVIVSVLFKNDEMTIHATKDE